MVDKDAKKQRYISNDKAIDEYFKDALNLPRLSKEETNYLIKKAQNNDNDALEKLINSNIRLIISIAKEFIYKASNMEIMDLIQEGIIGFVNAIKKYDENKSELSTYATFWIKAAIQKAVNSQNDIIKKASNHSLLVSKYNRLINDYLVRGEIIPKDEDICEMLNISLSKLKELQSSSLLEPLSTEISFGYDETMNLENIITSDIDNYKDVHISVDTERLLAVLKRILSPIQYFIIYHHIIFKTSVLEELGKLFGLGPERIRQIEASAIAKIKPYLCTDSELFKEILKSYQNRKINIHNVNTNPINPVDILKFLYIKNYLNGMEKKLFCLMYFDEIKYSDGYAMRVLKVDDKALKSIKDSLADKIKKGFNNKKRFQMFSKNVINAYGSKIFDRINDLEEKDIINEFANVNVEMLLETNDLQPYEEDQIRRYFNYQKKYYCSDSDIEKDIYLTVFGYKNTQNISNSKLYNTLLKNKKEFNEEEFCFLACFLQNNNIRLFLDKYPESNLMNNHKYLLTRLEMLYFNIDKLFVDKITKKEYLEVKNRYLDKLTERRIELLDMYFGINGNSLSTKEIAIILHEEECATKREIYTAIECVRSLYYSRSKGIHIDKDKYIPYILDAKYEFTKEMREVLKLYLISDLSYEEIIEQTGLSKSRIVNLVNDGLERIDLYRFKINKPPKININDLNSFFESSYCNLTELAKKVIVSKKCYLKPYQEIIGEFYMTKPQFDRIINEFNVSYDEYLTRNVYLEQNDILDEIETPINESVISLEDKKILSMLMGLNNEFNDGTKYTQRNISKLLSLSEDVIRDKRKKALINIALRKTGLKKPDLVYIGVTYLEKILDDRRIPISSEEKEIICYLFGLKDYKVKSLEEISVIFNMKPNHIKRKYKTAICNIYKYLYKEKEGMLDYEECILPYLKFFSKRDEILLSEYYKNNLTREEISKKYNISIFVVNRLLNRATDKINRILNNEEVFLFDYEFFRNNLYNEDLPYYGNIDLVSRCFSLFVGESTMESLSLDDISKRLNLSCSIETINRHVKLFVLSLYKYANGIKKQSLFSNEDVEEYYKRNCDNLSVHELNSFQAYFDGKTLKSEFSKDIDTLSDVILFKLLKDRNPDFFNLANATKEDIDFLLSNYYYELEPHIRSELIVRFNLNERNYMSLNDLTGCKKLIRNIT